MDDIAVVGIGLRFPGDATSPEELWEVLQTGQSQWSEFPKDRLNIDGYYHPGGDRQGSISFRGAHFLKDNVAAFDAKFFSVAAEDAKAIDPQQRMLLEASYEALQNAGIRKEDVDGSDTAVYVGSFVKDYEQICLRDPDWQPQYAATGNGIAIMANRISYAFNFHGPSVTLDTGCSASLVSVHLAAQSLRNGESSLAIAAGAGMILTPNTIMPMTALNFLSPDGKCFTFDARANGYGRGEGIGVVVLKRLSDALRDNDTIRAVIRGTSVNQDGRTTGITLPSKEAQIANIRSVYKSSGLSFDQTAYVECHGTGTQAGDWREVSAIAETLGTARDFDHPIVVGSLKPNIGHLEGAAGVAGLIKGVLMLERAKIPPNINFETPNPDIHFKEWKIKVPTSLMDWPMSGTRRVSVNCFGFGGTNAHVVMDEAPAYLADHGLSGNHMSVAPAALTNGTARSTKEFSGPGPQLFCFSASEKSGVQRVIDSQVPYVESASSATPDFLANYAYTLGCRRSLLEWKSTIVASSAEELAAKMRAANPDDAVRSPAQKQLRICFVFCGQGSQWARMGQDLMSFRVFRESLETATHYIQTTLEGSVNLMDEIFKSEEESRISEPQISQPATTALQVALVELLVSLSIRPTYVIGHSSGEIAAAFAAAAISRETAWKIAYHRGLSTRIISVKEPELKGGMIAVGMSEQECEEYLDSIRQPVQIACVNSSRSVTVSGRAEAIAFIAQDLRKKGVFHRVLPVNVAYHSDHMKLAADEYECALGHIAANATAEITMLSTLSGRAVNGDELDGPYWVQNMVSQVQYPAAVRQMMALPADKRPNIIVELSPRSTLKSPTLDILADMGMRSVPAYLSALDRKSSGPESLLQAIGGLWARGYHVGMEKVIARDKSYWHESHLGRATRFREHPRQDLIGAPTADSIPFEPRWRGFLRISENPWIQDHRVQKTIVYPAAGMASMVLEGAKQMARGQTSLAGYEIVDMRVEKAMIVPSTAHGLEMALNIKRDMSHVNDTRLGGSHEFSIYSKHLDAAWERNATGFLRFRQKDGDWDASLCHIEDKTSQLQQSCAEPMTPRQLYELLDTVGINYGPLFQNIVDLRKGGDSCIAKVRVPDTKSKMPAKFEYPHLIHPATLDSMFQTLFAIEPVPMVPTFIESLFVSSDMKQATAKSSVFCGSSTAQRTGLSGARADISMKLDNTESYVVINGLHLTAIAGSAEDNSDFLPNHRNLCTEMVWKEDVSFTSPGPEATAIEHLKLMVHKFPDLEILQVGGGLHVTECILQELAPEGSPFPKFARYIIADTADGSGSSAMRLLEGTSSAPYLKLAKVDDSESLADYHCILLVAGAGVDPGNLKGHLKPGGWMLTEDDSNSVVAGPSRANLDYLDIMKSPGKMKFNRHTMSSIPDNRAELVLLCHPNGTQHARGFGDALLARVPSQFTCSITVMALDDISQDVAKISGKVVISMLDADCPDVRRPFVYGWTQSEFEAFRTLHKAAGGIIWMTRGATMESSNPEAAPIIALARTLMSEDSQKIFATFDLSQETEGLTSEVASMMMDIFKMTFLEKTAGPLEVEFAERGRRVYIPRLTTIDALNQLIENDSSNGGIVQVPFVDEYLSLSSHGFKLELSKAGISADAFRFVTFKRPRLQANEVEVEYTHALLTFRDLEAVRGLADGSAVGMDVVGRVTRLGANVSMDKVKLETNVIALTPDGSLRNIINVDARLVVPARRGFVPSFFVSAYYGLVHMGRIHAGSKVLIHAGASSFGMAAIAVCSIAGADVYTTILGSNSGGQRDILQGAGLPVDRIFDANSSNFAAAVQQATAGKGVDAVYNPTQQHTTLSVDCIRPGGTIVQFQDRSSTPQSVKMTPIRGTYVNFDLAQMLKDDPGFVAELLEHTLSFLGDAPLEPNPRAALVSEIEIGDLENVFRCIEGRPYIGHLAVLGGLGAMLPVPVLAAESTKPLPAAIDPTGTYVLAGGLGGLGRSISELLVTNGARNLAFLSRSGASSHQAREFVQGLSQRGVNVRAYAVDICNAAALTYLVDTKLRADLPPVKGVFQCAAVIKDAVFDNMSYDGWCMAFRPKAEGSRSLVRAMELTGNDPFFVFLASSAGVIGNRGQANYAAGNCFEDALARSLRARGKHAVSIDLGPVLGAGMLAEDEEILDILRASGFYGIRHQDFLKVVKHAITMETLPGVATPAQVTLGVGTGGLMRQNQPADPYWSRTALYGYLNRVGMPPPADATEDGSDSATAARDIKAMLASSGTDAAEAAEAVCDGLMRMLVKSMNMLLEEMDAGRPSSAYGVDSLVAVGVRSWVFGQCGVQVSVFEVLSDRTVGELAAMIAERGLAGRKGGD